VKYGFVPTSLAERMAAWAGLIPIPAIDAIFSIMKARCLMAAVRLGVFEALKAGPRTADEVAQQTGLDREALEMLLRSLAFADYCRFDAGRFSLAPLARDFLVKGAKRELWGYLLWNYEQWEMAGRLEDLLRTGRGVEFHERMTDPEKWAAYQRGMLEVTRFDADAVARRVPVRKGAERLLDVAGGHGLLGVAVARLHPPLRAEVLDLPAAVEHARDLAREAGLPVSHRAGDLMRDEWGKGYDVVMLGNIVHHFRAEECSTIVGKARRALVPGGTVAIWEAERPDPRRPPNENDGAALFFRLTSTAGTYTAAEMEGWLAQARFVAIRSHRPFTSPGSVLVVGRVAD